MFAVFTANDKLPTAGRPKQNKNRVLINGRAVRFAVSGQKLKRQAERTSANSTARVSSVRNGFVERARAGPPYLFRGRHEAASSRRL